MSYASPSGSPPADAVGDLAVPRRLFIAGAMCLAALKLASQCYHHYQLYEVDRLVRYITEVQADDQEAAAAAAVASTAPVKATSSSLLSQAADSLSTTPPPGEPPLPRRSSLVFALPATTHLGDGSASTTPVAAAGTASPRREGGHDASLRPRRASSTLAGPLQDDSSDTTAADSFVSSTVPSSYSAVAIMMASTPSARTLSCGLSTSMATRDMANMFGGCSSTAESPTAAARPRDDLLCRVPSTTHESTAAGMADAPGEAAAGTGTSGSTSPYSVRTAVTPTAAADGAMGSRCEPDDVSIVHCTSPRPPYPGSLARVLAVESGRVAEAPPAGQPPRTPRVHLFIQPRWALAPSVSPPCTKWETFLRLHRVPYAVHEVHVLRSDPPQAQATDVPQQLQQDSHASRTASTSSQQSRRHAKEGAASAVDEGREDVGEAETEGHSAGEEAALEGGSFAAVLTETSKAQRAMHRAERALRRVVPPELLPSHLRTQYPIPFLVVDGQVLRGSFADVVGQLTARGLIGAVWSPRESAASPRANITDVDAELAGAAEASASGFAATSASASMLSTEEQRAVGQAVERTAEYTLRVLYDVGLVLEGTSVFSHYVAQAWRGREYGDLFQVRGWFVHAWLALPFLSVLKAGAERGLAAHELGGLTREQLYESLQSDLMSLEQLLVASASPAPSRRPSAQGSPSHVSDPRGGGGATPSPSPVPPSPEKRFRHGERGDGTAAGAADEEAEPVEVAYLLGREPGPQDCALYAYLLPILRLTPHDIACINNPNFDYIYESAVFHAFVQRMTAEAFPDLEALLHPPRPTGVMLQLLQLGWAGATACVAEAVTAARSGAAHCWGGARHWMLSQPLVRSLQRLHASGARQLRRGGGAVCAGMRASAAATASALRDGRQVLVDCAMYSRTLRRRGILDDITDAGAEDVVISTPATVAAAAAADGDAGAAAGAAATSSTTALSAYWGDGKLSSSSGSAAASVEQLDVATPVFDALPSAGAGRSGEASGAVPLSAPTALRVETPLTLAPHAVHVEAVKSPPPQPPTPEQPVAAAESLSSERAGVGAEAPRPAPGPAVTSTPLAMTPDNTAVTVAEATPPNHNVASPRSPRSRTSGTYAGRERSAQSGGGTECATVVECSLPAPEERAGEEVPDLAALTPMPVVEAEEGQQWDALEDDAPAAHSEASSHPVEFALDRLETAPSQPRYSSELSSTAADFGASPLSPALAVTQPSQEPAPHAVGQGEEEEDGEGPAELVYVLPSNSHDEWVETPTPAAAIDVTREPSPAPGHGEGEGIEEGEVGDEDVPSPSREEAADSTGAPSVTPSHGSSSVGRLPACSPSPRVLSSHSPPRHQPPPAASQPRKRRAAASPPFASSSSSRLTATPPPPPPVIATPSVRRSICVDDGRPHPTWRVKPQRSSASVESHPRRASPVQPQSTKASPVRSARSDRSPAGSAVPTERTTLIRKQRPSAVYGEPS